MPAATAPATAPATDDYDLLLAMRKATRKAHHIANALILSKLVVVLTNQKLYAQALSSFLPVYSALEQQMQQHQHVPGLSTVIAAVSSIPSRAQAMQADLEHLLGSDWRDQVPPCRAAVAYADHLQNVGKEDAVLLLPYVFSLHIPILLGFLGQRIQRTLQLPDKQGLAFFNVEGKADKLAALRQAVTKAGREIDPSKRQLLVNGAVEQFRRNNAVVAEFSLGWRPVLQAMQRAVLAVPVYVHVAVVAALLLAAVALVGAKHNTG